MPAIPTSVSPRNNYPTCPIFFRSPPRYFIEVRSENVPTEFYEVILKTGYPSPHMGNSERLKEYLFKQLRERNASLQSIASSNVGVRTLNRTSPSSPDQIEEELDPIKISLEENVRSRFEEEIRGIVEDVRRSVEEDIRPLISDVEDGIRRNEDGLRRLDDGIKRVEDGIRRNEDGLRHLDDGIKRVDDGLRRNEDGFDDGIRIVEEGQRRHNERLKVVEEGQRRLDDGIRIVEEGQRRHNERLKVVEEGQRRLDDGIRIVEEGQRRHNERLKVVEEGQRRLDDGIRIVEEGQRRHDERLIVVEEGIKILEESQRRFDDRLKRNDEELRRARETFDRFSEDVDELSRKSAEQLRILRELVRSKEEAESHMVNASLIEGGGIVVDMYQGDDALEEEVIVASRFERIRYSWAEVVEKITCQIFTYLQSFRVNLNSVSSLNANVNTLAIQTFTDESFGSISPSSSRVIEG